MSERQLKTTVALVLFNRPDMTEKVFQMVREVKPRKLLLIADGPRPNHPEDAEKCAAARAVVEQVDWDCEVLRNYSDVNLGMRRREKSGFDWVFSEVEEAIILEDDTLPDPTFFRFCEELLEKYRNDTRVWLISGTNFQFGRKRTKDTYYFGKFGFTWGWATWRRAWDFYDEEMKHWPKVRDEGWLKDILGDTKAERWWSKLFQETYEGSISTWDYQWLLSWWLQGGLSIVPSVNLVSNLGFYPDATNTKDASSPLANIPVEPMAFPLRHPVFIVPDTAADHRLQKVWIPPLRSRANSRAKANLKKWLVALKLVDERPGLERRVKEKIKRLKIYRG